MRQALHQTRSRIAALSTCCPAGHYGVACATRIGCGGSKACATGVAGVDSDPLVHRTALRGHKNISIPQSYFVWTLKKCPSLCSNQCWSEHNEKEKAGSRWIDTPVCNFRLKLAQLVAASFVPKSPGLPSFGRNLYAAPVNVPKVEGIDVWQYFDFLQNAFLGKVSQSLAKLGADLEPFRGCASCAQPT